MKFEISDTVCDLFDRVNFYGNISGIVGNILLSALYDIDQFGFTWYARLSE